MSQPVTPVTATLGLTWPFRKPGSWGVGPQGRLPGEFYDFNTGTGWGHSATGSWMPSPGPGHTGILSPPWRREGPGAVCPSPGKSGGLLKRRLCTLQAACHLPQLFSHWKATRPASPRPWVPARVWGDASGTQVGAKVCRDPCRGAAPRSRDTRPFCPSLLPCPFLQTALTKAITYLQIRQGVSPAMWEKGHFALVCSPWLCRKGLITN